MVLASSAVSGSEAVLFTLVLFLIVCVPAYVMAQRAGLDHPAVAFVPILGPWVVMLKSTGHSGWFSLGVLVPYLGAFVVALWMAFEAPSRHHRSEWWKLALAIPVINVFAYLVYALTFPQLDRGPALYA